MKMLTMRSTAMDQQTNFAGAQDQRSWGLAVGLVCRENATAWDSRSPTVCSRIVNAVSNRFRVKGLEDDDHAMLLLLRTL